MKTSKRTLVILLTLILSVASVSLVAAVVTPSAKDLLVDALESMRLVTDGHAVVEFTADLPADLAGEMGAEIPLDSLNGTIEAWGMLNIGPNGEPGFRVEVLAADEAELVGVTAVSNGVEFWLYDPNRGAVITGRVEEMARLLAQRMAGKEGEGESDRALPGGGAFDPAEMAVPETPEEAVDMALTYFNAERKGTDDLPGGEAFRLRLVPIPEQMPEEVRLAGGFVNVWLRTSDDLPLAVEYAESAFGYGRVEAALAEINTGFDAAIFDFVIPEDAEVIQAADLMAAMEAREKADAPADFTILTPTDLPEGATADNQQVIAGAVVQRYNLPGGGTFVIAQGGSMPVDRPEEATSSETVTVRGAEGMLFSSDAGDRTFLTWREGEGIRFLVTGDLTREQALAIAESLR